MHLCPADLAFWQDDNADSPGVIRSMDSMAVCTHRERSGSVAGIGQFEVNAIGLAAFDETA
ncbi:MAG: hypothetical protein OXI60_11480 [Acidiferrobacterales bacterium]|nr:hypothetical protein [Acidiferrobacterales bacterium]